MKEKSICEINEYGTKRWYLNGNIHRENDESAIEYANGDKEWWINGKLHRENDQPAIIYSFYKLWYKNGKYHRVNGPAIEYDNGIKSWWLNGERISCKTQEEFEYYMKYKAFL